VLPGLFSENLVLFSLFTLLRRAAAQKFSRPNRLRSAVLLDPLWAAIHREATAVVRLEVTKPRSGPAALPGGATDVKTSDV
jgi:hypothetical protein